MKAFVIGFFLVGMGIMSGMAVRDEYEAGQLQSWVGTYCCAVSQCWTWFLANWYWVVPTTYLPIGVLVARASFLIDRDFLEEKDPGYSEGGVIACVLLWPLVFVIQSVGLLCVFTYRASKPGLQAIFSFVRS
jgi:hypothetical protein